MRREALPDLPDLTGKEFIAMSVLVDAPEPIHGLKVVELTAGALKRGSVYATLNRLEAKGYVTSKKEDEQPGIAQPRRLYKATVLGAKIFKAVAAGRASVKKALA